MTKTVTINGTTITGLDPKPKNQNLWLTDAQILQLLIAPPPKPKRQRRPQSLAKSTNPTTPP